MTRTHLPRISFWMGYLALGLVALLVYSLLEPASLVQQYMYDAIGASAVVVTLVAVGRYRPDRRLPWILMAAGQGLFVAGDLLYNWYDQVGEDPFPSVADALYLAAYPLIALGLLVFIRRRVGGGDRGGLLDAAILATAMAILSWTFLMQPQIASSGLDPLTLAISLAYPVGDLLLIGVAMGLLATPGARAPSFRFLAISLGMVFAADQIYAIQNLDGTYVSGGPLDSLYLVGYLLFGLAAAHPSMRQLTDPHPVPITWLGPLRLVCLAGAMVTGPILVAVGPAAEGGLTVVAVGTALLSLLVLARLVGLVRMLGRDVTQRRALEAQLSYQAFHDPLTGLTNRRRFMDTADTALAARTSLGSIAVLYLDLDDFKTINDHLGHAAGDELLVAVADRLRVGLRVTDLVARLGGDEFGVLLRDIPNEAYVVAVSERILANLREPILAAGVSVEVGASLGIAIATAAMRSVDDLLGDADVAMYQAKALGKGRYQVFDPLSLEARAMRTQAWVERGPSVRRHVPGADGGMPHLKPGAV